MNLKHKRFQILEFNKFFVANQPKCGSFLCLSNLTNQKITDVDRIKIIQRFQDLLDKPRDKIDKERYSFYKRMGKERQQLFMEDVPSDSNASERVIRNVKVKQKISGQFKTNKAVQNFAMIRSVIDTLIKQNKNILQNLNRIAILTLIGLLICYLNLNA